MNPLVYKKMIETTELKPCKLCANENTNSCIGCKYSDGHTDMLTTYPPKEKDNFHIKCCGNCDKRIYVDTPAGFCKTCVDEKVNSGRRIIHDTDYFKTKDNDYCTWGWTRRHHD